MEGAMGVHGRNSSENEEHPAAQGGSWCEHSGMMKHRVTDEGDQADGRGMEKWAGMRGAEWGATDGPHTSVVWGYLALDTLLC